MAVESQRMEQSPLWWLGRKSPLWRGTWDGPWKWAGLGQLMTTGRRHFKWHKQMEQECCRQKAWSELVKTRAVLAWPGWSIGCDKLRSGSWTYFFAGQGDYVLLWQYGWVYGCLCRLFLIASKFVKTVLKINIKKLRYIIKNTCASLLKHLFTRCSSRSMNYQILK